MGYNEVVVLLFVIAFLGLMSNGGRRSGSNPHNPARSNPNHVRPPAPKRPPAVSGSVGGSR